ncbi:class I SAM-dependent methyltransferase [Silvimonas iriomotensis]|uniref:SAM-dependent methyltransferase n=1 Tax=Silvimonas iriomotensis TaxID=449662 RepID=A0ABQ2P5L4_9NEIS|nr:class I SAM-dependent methyltransferase [Silvimonas iriomotensis]GGP18419.1 SAM-dependent methyltransferase [Silvimonas iriomotensis]
MARWNPQDYARNSSGQERWAVELIAQLGLKPDDTVLDVGCGDGRHTAAIAAHVPQGKVLGTDYSPDMIAHAQAEHGADRHPNLTFEVADAAALPYHEQFSVVFSNAAIHWVPGAHDGALRGIAHALKPGGHALLQLGGHGNGVTVIAAFDQVRARPQWAPYFEDFRFPYGFHTVEDYQRWAQAAGLVVVDARMIAKTMEYPDRAALTGWFRTAWLPFIEPVPAQLQAAYLEEVTDAWVAANPGAFHVGMMRLQVSLARPA